MGLRYVTFYRNCMLIDVELDILFYMLLSFKALDVLEPYCTVHQCISAEPLLCYNKKKHAVFTVLIFIFRHYLFSLSINCESRIHFQASLLKSTTIMRCLCDNGG